MLLIIWGSENMKRWKKIVLSVFIIFAIFVGGSFGYVFYELNKMNTTKISKTDADLGIKSTASTKEEVSSDIINIALFGIDRRVKTDVSRSDSMIILSIDQKHKKIKMSSLMRDLYVEIKGHGQTKLTHAYAYGGPQLAIRTINENFNLNIRNYVTADFYDLEKLIDAVGGVTINVNQDEISLINSGETAGIEEKPISKVTTSGPQTLNGLQAVAYSRIRYTDGDDFKRTERQRTVLTGLFTKIKSGGATEFPSVVNRLLPFTETSMNSVDLIKLGTKVITSKTTTLEQERFPVDGYWSSEMINKVSYLVADIKATADQIHKFIYDDIKPVSKAAQ